MAKEKDKKQDRQLRRKTMTTSGQSIKERKGKKETQKVPRGGPTLNKSGEKEHGDLTTVSKHGTVLYFGSGSVA